MFILFILALVVLTLTTKITKIINMKRMLIEVETRQVEKVEELVRQVLDRENIHYKCSITDQDKKTEFFNKLAELSYQKLKKIKDDEDKFDSLRRARIKHA